MRLAIITLTLIVSGFLMTALIPPAPPLSAAVENSIAYFKTESLSFSSSCATLSASLKSLDPKNARSLAAARHDLAECRRNYKKIESFLEYFFRTSARIYNSPPKFEGEEPAMEYQTPMGLQVIEDGLFQKKIAPLKNDLLQQADAIAGSAADLSALLYDFKASDAQLLESLRLELIRIISLGITGFDAPLLQSGITESYEALLSIRHQIDPYLSKGDTRSDSLVIYLTKSIGYVKDHPGFNSFDRLEFLTENALPLQRQLGLFIREKGWQQNTSSALDYNADHLFRPDALAIGRFPNGSPAGTAANTDPALIEKGRILFYDQSLSGNGKRSCASCHLPEKMFTDGLPTALDIDGKTALPRNTPSLLYSSFQHAQFWDGRATSLRQQIGIVLSNPHEMNADTSKMDMTGITAALSAYLRTLNPMNSPFDRYMNGDKQALNTREKHGANLFMGSAQCATCHFAPLFNGLIPPYYQVTEFEVLGTTASDRFSRPAISSDQGRYALYPLDFYRSAFKTPTVRNAALTAPYMHNGSLRSLEKLMDFYNRGGGAGLGLDIPTQTLPARPLHLTHRAMADIILFLQALSDKPGYTKK